MSRREHEGQGRSAGGGRSESVASSPHPWAPSAFYGLFFAAVASLSPFLPLYFAELGLSGSQIGVLRGLPPLISIAAAPGWGVLADVAGRHKLLRMSAIAGSWLAVGLMAVAPSYDALLAVMAGYAVFAAPVTALVDNAVVSTLGSGRARYGQKRLWGAVGFGLGGLLSGVLVERYGLASGFVGYLVLMACCAVAAAYVGIRSTPSPGKEGEAREPRVQASRERGRRWREFRADLRRLLSDQRWLRFLVVVLVGGLFLKIELNYLLVYLEELGATETVMGVALLISTLSEIPVWAYSNRLLRRCGAKGLLALALAVSAVQATAYSLLDTPVGALPLQLLHGLTFPAMWTAGVVHASAVAPAGTAATAQAMFGATSGISAALGGYLGGILFDNVGGAVTFRLTIPASLTALLLLWVGRRHRDVASAQQWLDPDD